MSRPTTCFACWRREETFLNRELKPPPRRARDDTKRLEAWTLHQAQRGPRATPHLPRPPAAAVSPPRTPVPPPSLPRSPAPRLSRPLSGFLTRASPSPLLPSLSARVLAAAASTGSGVQLRPHEPRAGEPVERSASPTRVRVQFIPRSHR